MIGRRHVRRGTRVPAIAICLITLGALACGGSDDAADDDMPQGPQSLVSERVEVDIPNRPPVIEDVTFSPEQLRAGTDVQVVVQAHDADGDRMRFEYEWQIGGEPTITRGPRMEVPDLPRGETLTVVITPFDDDGPGRPYVAEISMGNRIPHMVELQIDNDDEGDEPGWSLQPVAEDPDGDLLDYEVAWLVNGEVRSEDPEWFSKEGLKRGDEVRVRARALDSYGASPLLESEAILIGNSSPRILSEPPGLGPGGAFRYDVEADDPDGDVNLAYALAKAPKGMIIEPQTGVVEWQPTAKSAGDHEIEITVSDGLGGVARQIFEVSVRVGGAPAAPDDEF